MLTCTLAVDDAIAHVSEGGDKMALGGYVELIDHYVKKWEGRDLIRNSSVVHKVEWKEGKCVVSYKAAKKGKRDKVSDNNAGLPVL